jgi:hypothetical protein
MPPLHEVDSCGGAMVIILWLLTAPHTHATTRYTPFWCDDFVDRALYNMTPSTSFNGTLVVDPVDSERFFGDTLDRGAWVHALLLECCFV